MTDRRRLYTLLQVGKTQLGWDDDFYRNEFLLRHGARKKGGRYSATTMRDDQLEAALKEMKRCGFQPRSKSKSKPSGSGRGNEPATPEQVEFIQKLWSQLVESGEIRSTDPASMRAWLITSTKRYHPQRRGWEEPKFMPRWAAARVIEQLKNWLARLEAA